MASDSQVPAPGTTASNPVTVKDTGTAALSQAATNPQDPDSSTGVASVITKAWPGPTADAGSVSGIKAVTADKAGPNVLVATDSTGKLPSSILPTSGYNGPSNQTNPTRVAGTAYTNSHTVPMWVVAKSGSGSNGNISTGLSATVGTSVGASPSLVVCENVSSSAGGGGPIHSVNFVVLPGYQYQVDTISNSIAVWTEWY